MSIPADARSVRQALQMTQAQFASRFGLSLVTLRQWEQGRRSPDGAGRALLAVIAHAPATVDAALKAAS